MIRHTRVVSLLALMLLAPSAARADEPLAEPAKWIPQEALLVAEVPRPKQVLDRVFEERIVKMVTSHPVYQQLMARPEAQQAMNQVKFFENRFNADPPTLLAKLLGGGITLAVWPEESFLVVVDTEDAELLEGVHDFLLMIAREEARKDGQPDRVASAEYRGVTGWRFGPNDAHAIIGSRLLLSNKPEVLKSVLDIRDGAGGGCLADSPAYRAAKSSVSGDAVASLYADIGTLKQLPEVDLALKGSENPLATLLFAPILAALREATWLTAAVALEGDSVKLDFAVNGTPGDPSAADGFALPTTADDGAWPNLEVPRRLAAVSLFRDLYRFYAAKDDLFPERTSGLIFFENMMGIFFTGRDLTEEVLAHTTPDVRLVVAEQEYDPIVGTPAVQIPGFAVVLRMRDAEKFAPIAEEAWQKALGLFNFTSGQQALPGLIIDRPTHAETKYTMSSFSAADEEDRSAVNMRHNFQPCLAMPGDYLIFSTSDGLTRDLIEAVKKETAGNTSPLTGKHSLAQIDGSGVSSILAANREALVRQNMVEDGNTREEAEAQIGVILLILQRLKGLDMTAGHDQEKSFLQLTVDLDLPQ